MRISAAQRIGARALLLLALGPAHAQPSAIEDAIRAHIVTLDTDPAAAIGGVTLHAPEFLRAFYGQRGFRPAWTDPGAASQLLAAIVASRDHGLEPTDFHWRELSPATGPTATGAAGAARRDILLSDGAARLLRQLRHGKVDPLSLDPDWNLATDERRPDPAARLGDALTDGTLAELIDDARLRHPYYLALQAALRSHREIASAGGWPRIAAGPALRPGMSDPRVPALRRRLVLGGDHDGIAGAVEERYDDSLAAAVRLFQNRHGLEADGIVGRRTLAALNVPVEDRIGQIRVNLERARWVLRELGADHLVVNIAGFYVNFVRAGREVWRSPVIVGLPYLQTPVFRGDLRYLVFNPDWTVPASIVSDEILPAWRRDAHYLERNHYRLLTADGRAVDPATVAATDRAGRSLPYRVVQQPGPWNPLGWVKFMFPNRHAVYLHDTPAQALFGQPERAFSHGCIRVRGAVELAARLLDAVPDWNQQRIEAVIAGGATTRVDLPRPVPVLLLYWTVDPDLGGGVRFYRDLYGRDERVLRALDD